MRRLVLHVGMHKTGTSSVQQSFAAAAKALRGKGWVYPGFAVNHSAAMLAAFGGGAATADDDPDGPAPAADPDKLAALEALVAARPDHSFLISGEGMARLDAAGVARLLAFGAAHFARTDVVAFVRPPVSLLHSKAQQYIKGGKRPAWLAEATMGTNYRWALGKFVDAVPPDRLHLRAFAPAALVEGDSVATLLDAVGLRRKLAPVVTTIRANESVSALGADLLLAATAAFAPGPGGKRPPRARALRALLAGMGGPRFWAPEALIERSLAASADDIAWASGVLGQDLHALDRLPPADASRYAPPTDPARLAELATLVTSLNAFLLRLEAARGKRKPGKVLRAAVDGAAAPGASSAGKHRAERDERKRERRKRQRDRGVDLADAERP